MAKTGQRWSVDLWYETKQVLKACQCAAFWKGPEVKFMATMVSVTIHQTADHLCAAFVRFWHMCSQSGV